MKIVVTILTIIFLFFSTSRLAAQSDTPDRQASFEVNVMPYAGGDFRSNSIRFINNPIVPGDTVRIFANTGLSGELQIKYVKPIKGNTNIHLGIYGGAHSYNPLIGIFDSLIMIGAGGGFRQDTNFKAPKEYIKYVTGSVGIGHVVNSMKNDKANFSIQGNATFYPKQNFGPNGQIDLINRDDNLELTSSSSLATEANVTFELDLDVNYQFGSEDSKARLTIGRIWRLSFQDAFSLETTASTPTFQNTFSWDYRKIIFLGLYLGVAYEL